MKKFWILAFIFVLALVLVACRDRDEPANDDNQIPVVDNNVDENLVDENDNEDENDDEENENDDDEDENDDEDEEDEDEEDEEDDEDDDEEYVIPARPANVVYSLSTDVAFQELSVGTRGGSEEVLATEHLIGAGNPTFRVIANPAGGRSLRIDNREADFHGVDIELNSMNLNFAANSYQLTVRGNISEAGNVLIRCGDTHATLFSQAGNGAFTLQFTMTEATLERMGNRRLARIMSNTLADLDIHEIEIRRVTRVAPVEVPPVASNVVYSLATDEGFQNSAIGLSGNGTVALGDTPFFVDSGSPTFTIVDNPVGFGHAIRVHGRQADWHTLDFIMSSDNGFNTAANTYTIRVRGRVMNPPAAIPGDPEDEEDEGQVSSFDVMGSGRPWARFGSVEVSGDGAFNITVTGINAASMAANGSGGGNIRLAASGLAGESVFYIYEIEVTRN
jgi:hypothetical protein